MTDLDDLEVTEDHRDPNLAEKIVNDVVIEVLSEVMLTVNKKVVVNDHDFVTEDVSTANKRVKSKVYPCTTCGKLFAQYPSSLKHCLVTKGSPSLACPVCGKVIKNQRNLKRHTETHNVIKIKINKACFVCNNEFSTRQKLEQHLVSVHGIEEPEDQTDEQLISCTQCSFSHKKASVVKGHISKSHGSDDELFCEFCDYSCKSRSGMFKHVKIVHRNITSGQKSNNEAPISSVALYTIPHAGGSPPHLAGNLQPAVVHAEQGEQVQPAFARRSFPVPSPINSTSVLISAQVPLYQANQTNPLVQPGSDRIVNDFLTQNFNFANLQLNPFNVNSKVNNELFEL